MLSELAADVVEEELFDVLDVLRVYGEDRAGGDAFCAEVLVSHVLFPDEGESCFAGFVAEAAASDAGIDKGLVADDASFVFALRGFLFAFSPRSAFDGA